MPDSGVPLFNAVASSARQLYFLLRCIGYANKVEVRITSEGLRFSVYETGVLESFIFLNKSLFLTYRLLQTENAPVQDSSSSPPSPPSFYLSLTPLLSTLQILTSASEPSTSTFNRSVTGPYSSDAHSSAFAAHRLNRHSLFSGETLGTSGQCRLVYRSEGSRLEISVPETGGVRTAGELATYLGTDAAWGGGGAGDGDHDDDDDGGDGSGEEEGSGRRRKGEEIPFDRDDLRLKVILPSSVLADALTEVGSLGPPEGLVVEASTTAPYLVLRGEGGSGGECRIEFGDESVGGGRSKLLETFSCGERIRALYGFSTVKKALVALRAGTKVSLRIDGRGVLSLQILVEVGDGSAGPERGKEEVAFVDLRIVPLFEQADGDDSEEEEEELGEDD